MKRSKLIRFFYTLLHIFFAVIVILFYILPVWIKCLIQRRRNKSKTVYKELANISKIGLKALGAPLYVFGEIQKGETFIVASNHLTYKDALVIAAFFNGMPGVGFVHKKMFKYPILGWFLKRVSVSIDGETKDSSVRAFWRASGVLRKMIHLFIFPEGHRTPDGLLGQFQRGAFTLAVRTQRRILPIGYTGAYEHSNKNSWLFNPGPLVVYVGTPIDVAGKTEEEISIATRTAILECTKRAKEIRAMKMAA